jgi:hypothetical protein
MSLGAEKGVEVANGVSRYSSIDSIIQFHTLQSSSGRI